MIPAKHQAGKCQVSLEVDAAEQPRFCRASAMLASASVTTTTPCQLHPFTNAAIWSKTHV